MYSEQVKEQHRRDVREANAARLAAGVCVMNTPHEEGPVRAEYVWHSPKTWWGVSNENPLCARCCALWRANAAEDPDLAPERITQL